MHEKKANQIIVSGNIKRMYIVYSEALIAFVGTIKCYSYKYVQENHSKPSIAEDVSINNLLFIRLVQCQYFLHLSYIYPGSLNYLKL